MLDQLHVTPSCAPLSLYVVKDRCVPFFCVYGFSCSWVPIKNRECLAPLNPYQFVVFETPSSIVSYTSRLYTYIHSEVPTWLTRTRKREPMMGRTRRPSQVGPCLFSPVSSWVGTTRVGAYIGRTGPVSGLKHREPLREQWEIRLWKYPCSEIRVVTLFFILREGGSRSWFLVK